MPANTGAQSHVVKLLNAAQIRPTGARSRLELTSNIDGRSSRLTKTSAIGFGSPRRPTSATPGKSVRAEMPVPATLGPPVLMSSGRSLAPPPQNHKLGLQSGEGRVLRDLTTSSQGRKTEQPRDGGRYMGPRAIRMSKRLLAIEMFVPRWSGCSQLGRQNGPWRHVVTSGSMSPRTLGVPLHRAWSGL
jgi:hypothetical protein